MCLISRDTFCTASSAEPPVSSTRAPPTTRRPRFNGLGLTANGKPARSLQPVGNMICKAALTIGLEGGPRSGAARREGPSADTFRYRTCEEHRGANITRVRVSRHGWALAGLAESRAVPIGTLAAGKFKKITTTVFLGCYMLN